VANLLKWLRFNLWYFRKPPWDTGVTPPELEALVQAFSPGKALDIGCGTGTNALRLLRAGWQVTGVDYALEAVNRARKKIQRAGFKADIHYGDVTRIQFSSHSFDLIYDIGCFHSLDAQSRQKYRACLVDWLANGGTFLLYGHLNDSQDASRPGITEEDILGLQTILNLEKREDSLDRSGRKAVWLAFSFVGNRKLLSPKDELS